MPAAILPNDRLAAAYRAAIEHDSVGAPLSPSESLLAYAGAFGARDAVAIAGLFEDNGLAEIPLLSPNRLVGRTEILRGHEAAIRTIATVSFEIAEPAEQGAQAIVAGTLVVQRINREVNRHALGVVAEIADGGLRRLGLYFDSRHFRRWADQTIF